MARGRSARVHCVIHGVSNYKQTGLLQAYAAYSLLQSPPKKAGFASACQAFGHRELLGVLKSFGLVMDPIVTVTATVAGSGRSGPGAERAMRLIDYLDKGAALGAGAPCLTIGERDLSYPTCSASPGASPARLSATASSRATRWRCSRATIRSPLPASSASRAPARVWCPINPRNEAAENRFILDAFDCARSDLSQRLRAARRARCAPDLPKLSLLVCLDKPTPFAPSLDRLARRRRATSRSRSRRVDDIAMIAGTGGTTGQPKGVMLSGRNLETMSALTLMSYPFDGRPVYLALAPLTHAAGVLCLPILALGGRIVIMAKADLGEFLDLIERRRVTHTFLPPTLIYMLLETSEARARPTEARSSASGTARRRYRSPASKRRSTKIGPVMAQLFGQTEAPMMISTMAPRDHFNADGTIARERLASAGRPTPLIQLAVMDEHGRLLPQRRAGRDRGARIAGDGGLLQEPGGDGGGDPVRMASHRRHRLSRRQRIFSSSSTAPRT